MRLDLSDALNEEITVANQSSETIVHNFGLLLDGVGWPDDADWRDIDADLIEQLSAWEHSSGRAITSAQALVDTVGPPARMVIRRNGGMRVIKDVSDVIEASFTDADVRELPDLQQHEDSVINSVTIEGTTLGSIRSTVRNTRPLEYMVLDGLAATERVNVIRRILRAYENGLTTLDLDFHADNDRNQASVSALEPGTVIELQSDFLGQTYEGPVSGLRWRWEGTRAFVRANVEIQPPPPEVFGLRLYLVVNASGGVDDFLYFIDAETGLATQISTGDPQGHFGLAYNPNLSRLYGKRGSDEVLRIDTTSGVGTVEFDLTTFAGYVDNDFGSLAYDNDSDLLLTFVTLCWRIRDAIIIRGLTLANEYRSIRRRLITQSNKPLSERTHFEGMAYTTIIFGTGLSVRARNTGNAQGFYGRVTDDGTVTLIRWRNDGNGCRVWPHDDGK